MKLLRNLNGFHLVTKLAESCLCIEFDAVCAISTADSEQHCEVLKQCICWLV